MTYELWHKDSGVKPPSPDPEGLEFLVSIGDWQDVILPSAWCKNLLYRWPIVESIGKKLAEGYQPKTEADAEKARQEYNGLCKSCGGLRCVYGEEGMPCGGCNGTGYEPLAITRHSEPPKQPLQVGCKVTDAMPKYQGCTDWPVEMLAEVNKYCADWQERIAPAADKRRDMLKDVMGKIMSQREEILEAFVAKYGFDPDEIEQVHETSMTESKWYVRHRPARPYIPGCEYLGQPEFDEEGEYFLKNEEICIEVTDWGLGFVNAWDPIDLGEDSKLEYCEESKYYLFKKESK